MISFSHVSLTRGTRLVLDDVTFEVSPGEFVCIVGESGSGKTSLFRLLLALEKPSKGTVSVDEIDLSSLPLKFLHVYRQSIGYLPQDDLLLPRENVAANIAFPLRIRKMRKAEIEKSVAELLLALNLLDKGADDPAALARSDRRKVALARAMIAKPAILPADEPFSTLTGETARTMLTILKERNHKGTTVLFTTCERALAECLQVRTLQLQEGRLLGDARHSAPVHAHIPLASV